MIILLIAAVIVGAVVAGLTASAVINA